MGKSLSRREVLGYSAVLGGGLNLAAGSFASGAEPAGGERTAADRSARAAELAGGARAAESARGARAAGAGASGRRYQLGLVTYNLAAKLDLPTLLKVCKDVGLTAVEFRTTHKHGVEPTLSKAEREEVRKRCTDAGLQCWSLGSTCEYHSSDPAVVQKNIEATQQFIDLARDIGAKGVKVRPNGLPKNVPVEKTLEQIGESLKKCGQMAAGAGVEIWCEVHGSGTSQPENMLRIMQAADHPTVGATWNSNGSDVKNGSIREFFTAIRPRIYSCHITEIISGYPWRELFGLFNATGYDRFTLIEAPGLECDKVGDLVRFLRYYKALWEELTRVE